IGEDVAPAVPARGRGPAPRAIWPAGRGDSGARGELAFLRRGDVADPVADLGHQRVFGAVEGDDHAQRGDSGGPGRRHRADRVGRRPARLPGELLPGVGRRQRHKNPPVVHLVVQPDGRPPGLAWQPDHGRDVPGPDDVIGRLAQHVRGGCGDGREAVVLCWHHAPPLAVIWSLTCAKTVIIGTNPEVEVPRFFITKDKVYFFSCFRYYAPAAGFYPSRLTTVELKVTQ